ncbi:hypothetical protein [Roseovarius sp. EL26]|uniref:hypothetical protein n=1 Tax=Roseovarius sp. EL26 TaxID=2126672 RepID=UPI0013C4CCF1|nr:hypothetical protein [Roseovarius sp. EL26]
MTGHLDQLELFLQKIMATSVEQRYCYASHWAWMLTEAQKSGVDIPPEFEALRNELDEEAMEAQFDNMPI